MIEDEERSDFFSFLVDLQEKWSQPELRHLQGYMQSPTQGNTKDYQENILRGRTQI